MAVGVLKSQFAHGLFSPRFLLVGHSLDSHLAGHPRIRSLHSSGAPLFPVAFQPQKGGAETGFLTLWLPNGVTLA